jgi:hypothetical protein
MHVDQLRRGLLELEGAKAALAGGAVGAVLDDLPVATRYNKRCNTRPIVPEFETVQAGYGSCERSKQCARY